MCICVLYVKTWFSLMKTQPSNTSVMLLYYYWVPMYEVLPKCFWNWNATRKPLVVQLCTTRYRKPYPLWIIMPSGFLLWERVCGFLWHRVSAVLWSYCPAEMTYVKQQRICIKFCFKLSKTALEIHRMLKEAFGDNALGQTQTYKWFKLFKDRRMSVNDEEHSGRPLTRTTAENMAKVWYRRHGAYGICSTRTDGEWKILLWSSEVVEVKTSSANVQTSGATTPGPSIMTCVAHCAAVFGFYE